jgi:hypothetical protein
MPRQSGRHALLGGIKHRRSATTTPLVLQPDFVIIGVEGVGGSGIRGLGLDVVGAIVTRRVAG